MGWEHRAFDVLLAVMIVYAVVLFIWAGYVTVEMVVGK